ncbi:MAG: hypothetical protein K1Y36_16760 [Blastocatellia bacterium]|nr:hypothetical protein [Blastocatellia bacterium]
MQQDADNLVAQAEQAYLKKDYARSAQLFLEASKLKADDTRILYNAACSLALCGKKNEALNLVESLVRLGYSDGAQLQQDMDFQSLHQEPRWKKAVAACLVNEKRGNLLWNNPALTSKYQENLPEEEKIAGLSRLWSEAKFNFANFDLVPELDWDRLYLAYLAKVRQTKNTAEFYRVLAEFLAHLKDGHTDVGYPNELASTFFAVPGLGTRMVENHVLVRRVVDPQLTEAGIKVGMEILEVNGMPVRTYADKFVKPYISVSTAQDLENRMFGSHLLRGNVQEPISLTLQDESGNKIKKTVSRLTDTQWDSLKLPPTPLLEFKILEGNVGLLSLNSFNDPQIEADFAAVLPRIQTTDGLIIDIRNNGGGNSGHGWKILAQLADKTLKTSQWRTRQYRPSYRAWGFGESWYTAKAAEYAPEGGHPYLKPFIVLTSPRTFSAAEDFAVAFDATHLGLIVGEPTGGSTGQPLSLPLPGGGWARICTKRDAYPDGKEFVGVGVQPQILVKPTVADFRAGKDTVLLAAQAEMRKLMTTRNGTAQ